MSDQKTTPSTDAAPGGSGGAPAVFAVPSLQTAHDGHAVAGAAQTPMGAASTPHAVVAPQPVLPTKADDYEVICEIGAGAFAQVYKAIVKGTTHEVAIKIVDLDQFNTNWDEIRKEILTMSSMHHQNVVKILQSFADGSELWIVMPLLSGGSCASLMKTLSPNGFKDEALIATILMEALKGLHYLHKDGRIHRDIKAGNILIGGKGDVMLADFGVSGTLMENGDRKRIRQTFTGTPCWMAPEVMEQTNGYDYKADIWSFGITALELAYGRAPYSQFQPMKVLLLTLQEEPPTAEIYKDNTYKFSKHFHSMVSKCLRKDPTKRPNTTKLLGHKFFRTAQKKEYIVQQLISKLPPPAAINPAQRITKPAGGKMTKQKPVTLGSLVFDDAELESMKKQISDEKKAAATTPAPTTATAATGTAAAAAPTAAPNTGAPTAAHGPAGPAQGGARASLTSPVLAAPLGLGAPAATPYIVPADENVLHIHSVSAYSSNHPASPSSASSARSSLSSQTGTPASVAALGSNRGLPPPSLHIASIPKSSSNTALNLLSPMTHHTPPINLGASTMPLPNGHAAQHAPNTAPSTAPHGHHGHSNSLSAPVGVPTLPPPSINTHSPALGGKTLGTLGAPLTPSAGGFPVPQFPAAPAGQPGGQLTPPSAANPTDPSVKVVGRFSVKQS